jgi:hypothetical protein
MEALTGSVVRAPHPAITNNPVPMPIVRHVLIANFVLDSLWWFIQVSDFRR